MFEVMVFSEALASARPFLEPGRSILLKVVGDLHLRRALVFIRNLVFPRLLALRELDVRGDQKLVDRGQIASPVTLKATFDQDTALAPIGGAEYLAKLAGAGASLARVEVEVYARLVYDHWQRRQLIEFGEDVVGTAYRAELDNPASAQIERAESWLYRLAESGDTGSGFQPLSAATGRAIEIAPFHSHGSLKGFVVSGRWPDSTPSTNRPSAC